MTEAVVEPKKTPEELAQEELAAQAEDLKAAKDEIAAREPFVPPAPFKVLEQYADPIPGPLAYETHRGLIKVFTGDIKAVVEYEVKDAEGNPVLDEQGNPKKLTDQFVVCSEAFLAMFPDAVIPPNLFQLAYQKGVERRKAAAPPLTEGGGGTTPPAEPPAEPIVATGATAGTPGSYTPSGAEKPTTLAGFNSITANPTTPWTTGQYVPYATSSKAYWDGTAWKSGTAS